MDGEEKTEHIPAIFEIGPLLNWNQLFSPGEKKKAAEAWGWIHTSISCRD